MNDKIYKSFYLFLLNLGIVSLVLFVLHKLSLLRVDLIFNESWLFAILIFSFTFCIAVKDKLNRSRYLTNRNIETIFEVSPYFFLSILIILAVNQFLKLDFLISRNFHIVVLGIAFGFLAFYRNRDRIENELEDEKKKEEEKERDRANDFEYKFPRINRIWGIRSIVKWMYKEGWSFSIPFAIITLIFIGIKIGMPLIYNGSYIDEYNHIFSGIEFFKTGNFPELGGYKVYKIGAVVSFLEGLFLDSLGNSLFVAKLLPLIIGIGSFFLVYKISREIKMSKKYLILILLIYSLSPWIIFNHFYIRIYSVIEFFSLLLIYTFLLLIKRICLNGHKTKLINPKTGYLIYLSIIIVLFNFLFNRDIGFYITLLIFLISLLFIILTNIDLISRKFVIITIFVIIILSLLFIKQISFLLFGNLTTTSNLNPSYYKFFLNLNLPLFLFFIFSIIGFKSLNKPQLYLLFVGLCLFFVHIFSSKDLQIIRAILYFLPIFYLVSIFNLNRLKIKSLELPLILIVLLSIVSNYPPTYLNGPYIPLEIEYMSGDIYDFAKLNCVNSIIITNNDPGVLIFNGIVPDYKIHSNLENSENYIFYDEKTSRYYDIYTKIPAITKTDELIELTGKVCYIERRQVSITWVSEDMRKYIDSNFKVIKEFQGQKLFIRY